MLIVLGGFIGSGRVGLARRIARDLHFHHRDFNEYKMRTHAIGADGFAVEKRQEPKSDTAWIVLFDRALNDLELLTKMHDGIVFDTSFHRAASREYFLERAKRRFGEVAFVWIDSDEETAKARIEKLVEKHRLPSVAEGLRQRAATKRGFQPFDVAPLTYHNTHIGVRHAHEVIELIRSNTALPI